MEFLFERSTRQLTSERSEIPNYKYACIILYLANFSN